MPTETNTSNSVQTLLKEKFAHIYYDPATRIIAVKWSGFLRLEDAKAGCKLLIDFIRTNKLTNNFNDQTELKVLSKEVQQYLVGEVFPELERIGLQRIAVLVAEDIFATATVNNVNTKVSVGGLTVNTFNSKDKCYQWLLS